MNRGLAGAVLVALVVGLSFEASALYVNMSRIGEGSTNPPFGVNSFSILKKVSVTATPAAGWSFSHWEGDFYGKGASFSFYITGDKRATAVFKPNVNTADNSLVRFVGKHDANFSWYEVNSATHFGWSEYTWSMTSQQWRTAAEVDRPLWVHEVNMIDYWFSAPKALLMIDGGSNPPGYGGPDSMYAAICAIIGMDMVDVKQIPNEPLYFTDEVNRRRSEDEILAYSLDKYLLTGDDTWPVHQAMAKAAVRAMDIVQKQFPSTRDWLVAGGSKRGWTTWLVSAVDPRTDVFAPLVIDVLNMDEQVKHFWEAYGFYQPAVEDYVEFDLFCRLQEPNAANLLKIIDPYEYIDDGKFMEKKYILNATGDQFFLPDGTHFYWNQVPGPKWLRCIPNADHGIQNDENLLYDVLFDSLDWANRAIDGGALPSYSWTLESDGSIRVQTVTAPSAVRLWQATNPNARDFRIESVGPIFTSSPLYDQGGGVYVGYCPPPPQGWTCFLVELDYGLDYTTAQFTTETRITPDILPFEGTACQ